MAEWKAKRFWEQATAVEADGGWQVMLDARPVRTPGKHLLVMPTLALAEAVAQEWDAQEGEIDPLSMPFTRASNSTIERVMPQHDAVAEMLAAYGGTDLLCYRANAPAELVSRQEAAWDPLLDWAAEYYGARLKTGSGVMHIAQDADAVAVLGRELYEASSYTLTALHDLITISGSLVLALAVYNGHLSGAQAWESSTIDEQWQAEQWGEDEEAANNTKFKREAFLRAEVLLGYLSVK